MAHQAQRATARQGGTMTISLDEFTERRPYNAVTDFVDANVARGLANKVAFSDGTRSLTYGELQAATCRCAGALRALGLRQESRIALAMLDTVDLPVLFWGALRAGIVPILLNTLLNTEQYGYMLEDSRAEALFVSAPLAAMLAPIVAKLRHLHVVVIAGGEAKDKAIFSHQDVRLLDDILAHG